MASPVSGEIHFEAPVIVIDRQQATDSMEANRPGVMSTQRKCIRRSHGCVAAQDIFHYRCEPTQVEIAISAGNDKRSFAVTVLRCDFLHDFLAGNAGTRHTPAGLPANSSLAKESMW
jgi:hypothetical protein